MAPTWTEEKLRILECYLNGLAKACKKAGGWYALDLFAGGAMNISKTTGTEIAGSPLLALEAGTPNASLVVCCEQGPAALSALRDRTASYGSRIEIVPGDANVLIGSMLERVPAGAPAFAFLDPEGADLAWETVRAIAQHKPAGRPKVEQLILLPTDMGFVRLLPLSKPPDERSLARVGAMFGNKDWMDVYMRRRGNKITAGQAREEYLALYARGLREELGYKFVQERQITKEPSKAGGLGSPMYFLLFASDKEPGRDIMDHCFNKKHLHPGEELGQISMLSTPVAPRRRRKL